MVVVLDVQPTSQVTQINQERVKLFIRAGLTQHDGTDRVPDHQEIVGRIRASQCFELSEEQIVEILSADWFIGFIRQIGLGRNPELRLVI